jgi:hypothetical protein
MVNGGCIHYNIIGVLVVAAAAAAAIAVIRQKNMLGWWLWNINTNAIAKMILFHIKWKIGNQNGQNKMTTTIAAAQEAGAAGQQFLLE